MTHFEVRAVLEQTVNTVYILCTYAPKEDHAACSHMNMLTALYVYLHSLFYVSLFYLSSSSHFLSLSLGRAAEKEWAVRCMFNL